MATIKLTAKKMSDASVSFISLVERGANRIPFKVIKQEKDMSKAFAGLDLGSLFTRKAEAPKPEIVGVVTLKDENFDKVREQIEAAGFDVSQAEDMEDGSVVFKQGEFSGEGTVIRMNEHVALITKNFTPYDMAVVAKSEDGQSMTDVCKAEGFYPGIGTMTEVIASMVYDAVVKAESTEDAQEAVSGLFNEASAYVSAMVGGLPLKAFKLETIEIKKADDPETPEDTPPPEDAPADAESVEKGCKPKDRDMEPPADESAPAADADMDEDEEKKSKAKAKKDEAEALTAKEVADIVATTVGPDITSMTQKMETLVSSLEALTTSMNGVTTTVAGLATRVEDVEKVAKAAGDAVSSTIVSGAGSEDHAPAKKSETGVQRGREIDTAFMPRVRKSH